MRYLFRDYTKVIVTRNLNSILIAAINIIQGVAFIFSDHSNFTIYGVNLPEHWVKAAVFGEMVEERFCILRNATRSLQPTLRRVGQWPLVNVCQRLQNNEES